MKLHLIFSILLITLLSNTSYSQQISNESPTHCPFIDDIKYDGKRFYANTSYSGKSIEWEGEEFFRKRPIIPRLN